MFGRDELRRFSIPSGTSSFDVANQIWQMMEGQ
jgi:hypothetical protein